MLLVGQKKKSLVVNPTPTVLQPSIPSLSTQRLRYYSRRFGPFSTR
jgi:hypothetical protein